MDEHAILELIREVERGRLSRRRFLRTMVATGLTTPMAAGLLRAAGVAQAQPRTSSSAPTRRGGGGQVRMLYWAAPTLLNPHLAVAPKDFESSQLFYEPLADIDTDGTVVPVLAAETPSIANGGVSRDGTSVVWRLKRGVVWHGGHERGLVPGHRSHRPHRRLHGEDRLQAADAVLGRRLLQRGRDGLAAPR